VQAMLDDGAGQRLHDLAGARRFHAGMIALINKLYTLW
jgi:hypothetical protein